MSEILGKKCVNIGCPKRFQWQPISNFAKRKHTLDGHDGMCNDCRIRISRVAQQRIRDAKNEFRKYFA